ncbi:MAG: hydrogenase 4 subunit F [Tatlockia sp.]|jgi:hydrogenase-4 component F
MLIACLLFIPLLSALLLAFVGARQIAAKINILSSLLSFIAASGLAVQIKQQKTSLVGNGWFYVDYLSVFLIVLTSFIGLTTAIYSVRYLINEQKARKLTRKKLRFYYSLYQFFFFTALLILVTNNLGILWVAMECATLITVLLVGLYHIPQSLEAAWKYLILCGFGLTQALLGTILFFIAAEKLSDSHNMLLWTELHAVSSHLSPHMISIAFVFILVGYGTKAGLVPLHNWLPDVYGESIAPVLALLSGVLLNLAFYAILRFKQIADGASGPEFSNHLLQGFGLLNIVIAGFFLLRQREIKRFFAYSSIEHIGLISFAFGLGSPLALFAGLLHMMSHSLAKSAVFFSAGYAIQARNSLFMKEIRGLNRDYPGLGWGLLLSAFSLIGLPPSALFTSEFLILFISIKEHIVLTIPCMIGLSITFAATLFQVQNMVFDQQDYPDTLKSAQLSLFPIYIHLILIICLGVLIPVLFAHWDKQIIPFMSEFL